MRLLRRSRIPGHAASRRNPPSSSPETHRKEVSMWSKKNADEMSPLDTTVEHETAWLGSSWQVKGEITGTEDLLVAGAVEGRIHLDERKLTVGTTAKVMADFEGSIEIDRSATEQAEKNVASRAAAAGAGSKSI